MKQFCDCRAALNIHNNVCGLCLLPLETEVNKRQMTNRTPEEIAKEICDRHETFETSDCDWDEIISDIAMAIKAEREQILPSEKINKWKKILNDILNDPLSSEYRRGWHRGYVSALEDSVVGIVNTKPKEREAKRIGVGEYHLSGPFEGTPICTVNILDEKEVYAAAARWVQDQEFVEPGERIKLEFNDAIEAFHAGARYAASRNLIAKMPTRDDFEEWAFNNIECIGEAKDCYDFITSKIRGV